MSFKYIIVSISLLLVATAARAAIVDDFETYSEGNINGQGSWVDYSYTQLKTDYFTAYHGLNYIEATSTSNAEIYKVFTDENTGTQCGYIFYRGITMTLRFIVQYNGSSPLIIQSQADNNRVSLYYNSISHVTADYLPVNQWNFVCISYTATQVNFYYNSAWSGWNDHGYSTGFNKFTLGFNTNGSSDRVRLDYLGTTSVPPNAVIDTSNIDITLANDRPDFNTVSSMNCWLDRVCHLWFSYNALDLGGIMYLLNSASSTVPTNAIASTTVQEDATGQNFVIVPPPSDPATKIYNLLLDVPTYGWNVQTGIKIQWLASSTSISDLAGIFGGIDHVCDDVATSSFEFWDLSSYAGSFRYAIECAARKVSYWAFIPDPNAQKYFFDSVTRYESTFPVNTAFSLINKVGEVAATSTTMNDTIDVVLASGISSTTYTSIPALSSTTMSNVIGSNNANTIRDTISYILYIITAAGIVLIVVWPYLKPA